MAAYDFSLVEALVVDPQPNTMRLLRDILGQIGITAVRGMTSYGGAAEALSVTPPDVLMIDANGVGSEAFPIVRSMRNDADSENPFVSVVVLTWEPTAELVTKVVNCGADLLVVKPASLQSFTEHFRTLIENRRRYVVTADYLGPDRRKAARVGTQIPLLDVPNTLRLKAKGQWTREGAQELLSGAKRRVRDLKIARIAFQIAFLATYADPGLRKTPPDRLAREHAFRIPDHLQGLMRRLNDRGVDPETDRSCRKIEALVGRMQSSIIDGKLDARLIDELSLETMTLLEMLSPNKPSEEVTREVTQAVRTYGQRLQEILAAKRTGAG